MAHTNTPIALNTLKLADILAAAKDGKVTPAQVLAELTRRIDQRAAAGKHPMPFVIAARDEIAAVVEVEAEVEAAGQA